MNNFDKVEEYKLQSLIRIHEFRTSGDPYVNIHRLNIDVEGELFTLEIENPIHGLETSNKWIECEASYRSIKKEICKGKKYLLYDGPLRAIGELEALEA